MKFIPYEHQLTDICEGGLFFALPEEMTFDIYESTLMMRSL
jgi:hypothetical protein